MADHGVTEAAESSDHGRSERVAWELRRTLLSKERTYTAWVRTGLAAEAAGLAVARWLHFPKTSWIAPTLGATLVIIGACAFVLAFVSYRNSLQELERARVVGTPLWTLKVLTVALSVVSALALILIATWWRINSAASA